MIKTVKKAFCILITVCMLFAIMPTAMAEDVITYSLQGDATIFAPPAGSFSKVEYKLIKTTTPDGGTATSETVDGATLSISGTIPAGVSLNAAKTAVLIDGSKIKNGSFKVTATKGDETASKTVTVVDERFFFDFQDATDGSAPPINSKNLAGEKKSAIGTWSPAKAAAETNGNLYANATNNYSTPLVIKPANAASWSTAKPKISTLEFDVKNPKTNTIVDEYTGAYEFAPYASNNVLFSKNGGVNTGFTFSSTEWTKMQVILDYYNFKYTLIANGTNYGTYDMSTQNDKYPQSYRFACATDNVSMYSGIPVTVSLSADIVSSLAVGSKDVKIPLSADGTISIDGGTISTDVKWSTASAGASIVDNKYLVINRGTTEDITLTAVGSGVKKNYTIDIVSALENIPADNKIGAAYLGGISKIEASFSGTNVVLKGIGSDIDLGEKENSKLHIYFDEITKEYIAICDAVTVGSGTFTTLSDVELSGATITQLYAGGIFHEAPMALDAKLLPATPVVGQSMAVIYTYFSWLGYEEIVSAKCVTWYLEDAAPQTMTNFAIDKEMVGKNLRAEVTVDGGGETSEVSTTSTETIKDVYEVSLDGNSVEIKILSIEEEAENNGFIIGVEWLNGGQSVGTLAKAIDYDGDTYTITADTTIDDARVWLMYNDLSPLAGEKYASGAQVSYIPSGKTQTQMSYADGNLYVCDTSGAMTTVVIYKPVEDNDFAQSSSFPFGILETENEVNLDDYIAYMGVIAPDAKIPFDISLSGLYKAEGITQSGENSTEFIIGKEKLFTEDKLQELSEEEFDKVMLLTGGTADYDEYQKADPNDVSTLMQGEGYDMAEIETAVLLSAFLEDKNNKEALVTNLTARSLDISGIAIIIKNHNFTKSASLVTLDAGIENALESIFETAILQGVANSGNYIETMGYLSSIGGYTVSEDMALAFTPSDENSQVYATLAALKAALDSYTDTPSTDGGTDTGTDNSNDGLGGTTGNSGFVGGSGGGGGGGSQSTPKDDKDEQTNTENQNAANSAAHTFSDVSANHWASSDISYLVENKIISGMGDGSFKPEKSITRAEFLKILAVAFPITATEDAAQFEDVSKDDWYYQYVIKASEAGVVSGDGRNFRPNDAISRQDAAVMLYRVLTNLNVELDEGESTMTDSADISSYALNAVNALYGAGIINGMGDGTFMPKNNITRAQAAAIVARVLR